MCWRKGVMLGCRGTAGGCCDGNPVKSDPYKGGAEGQVLPLNGLPPHAETDGPMEERSRRPTGLLTHAHTHTANWCGGSPLSVQALQAQASVTLWEQTVRMKVCEPQSRDDNEMRHLSHFPTHLLRKEVDTVRFCPLLMVSSWPQ